MTMTTKSLESRLVSLLRAADDSGRRRRTEALGELGAHFGSDGRVLLNFSTNDYLGLRSHPQVLLAAQTTLSQLGLGAGASRLTSGTAAIHEELEARLAKLLGVESALLFGAGYLANIGCLGALLGRDDVVLADRLVHASLLDGMRLSGAELRRYRHNDLGQLEDSLRKAQVTRRKKSMLLVVTESIFSMDGDRAPLADLWGLCARHDAGLLVDDAHALGVCGPNGAGCAHALQPNDDLIVTCTLSKALGSYGGVVGGAGALREVLVSTARSFIFNTALPPLCAAGAIGALEVLAAEPERQTVLRENAIWFRSQLRNQGFDVPQGDSPIVPVVVGENHRALRVSAALKAYGVYCRAIRPPTVPEGTARLRFSLSYDHDREDLARAVEALSEVRKELAW